MDIKKTMETIRALKQELGVDGVEVSINPNDDNFYFHFSIKGTDATPYQMKSVYDGLDAESLESVKTWAAGVTADRDYLLGLMNDEDLIAEESERVA